MPENRIDIEQLEWVPIPAELSAGLARQPLSKRKLKQWMLVLQARGVPYRTARDGQHWQLLVPADRFQLACEELAQYEEENRNWPPPPPPERKLHENTASTIWVLILLALFHNLAIHETNPFGPGLLDWTALGNADAGKILHGDWWRPLTALTLHSGTLHLVSNIIVGGLFITRLCWILGAGYAWLLVLASGYLGNLLNALVQSPDHRSIGASTAVFGAIGLLATLNMLYYRHALKRRWPLPVAAALGVLAMLGTAGENTDIGAHLFGFAAGIVLGLVCGYFFNQEKPLRRVVNIGLACVSLGLVIVAWWAAVGFKIG